MRRLMSHDISIMKKFLHRRLQGHDISLGGNYFAQGQGLNFFCIGGFPIGPVVSGRNIYVRFEWRYPRPRL